MEPVRPDDEAVAAFGRDGVACLRSVLDPAEVAIAAAAIDAVLARPGPLAQVASAPGDPGAFTEDFCRWREIGEIERLARHRPGAAPASPRRGPRPSRTTTWTAGGSARGSRWTRCPRTGAWSWWRARTAARGGWRA